MRDNLDISPLLSEQLKLDHELHGGRLLYTAPFAQGEHLYRSMSFEEARDWLNNEDENWLPPVSGVPWSTNGTYSREYLVGNCTVQLEVPVGTILARFRAIGLRPKYEGPIDAETWGTGPVAEIGLADINRANRRAIKEIYETKVDEFGIDPQGHGGYAPGNQSFGSSLQGRYGNFTNGDINNLTWALNGNNIELKKVTSLMFRTLFKREMHMARVVARVV